MERLFNVCDRAKIKRSGKIVLVIDYSDSHGLCYQVVEPNFNGSCGRKENVDIYWIEPEYLEKES